MYVDRGGEVRVGVDLIHDRGAMRVERAHPVVPDPRMLPRIVRESNRDGLPSRGGRVDARSRPRQPEEPRPAPRSLDTGDRHRVVDVDGNEAVVPRRSRTVPKRPGVDGDGPSFNPHVDVTWVDVAGTGTIASSAHEDPSSCGHPDRPSGSSASHPGRLPAGLLRGSIGAQPRERLLVLVDRLEKRSTEGGRGSGERWAEIAI